MDLPLRSMTFIVRATLSPAGQVTGVVERVSTGQKVRFQGIDEISRLIARLADEERSEAGPEEALDG